jgi:hypothetical protein
MVNRRPSFGRSRAARGGDLFDTPPIALEPLFAHEPLLAGVTSVAEPFCGKGNLVVAMRARGLTVHASDLSDRGYPDSTVLDFRAMTVRPPGCDVLLSNPPYGNAMDYLEHAWALGFRVVVLLLPPSFLHTADRYKRMHERGRLRRVHVWPRGCRACTTLPTSPPPARRAASPTCTPGSCSIGTTAARQRSTGIHPSACRAHAVGTSA